MTIKYVDVLCKFLDNRIKENRNNLIAVVGSVGSGKSFTSLCLAEKLDPTFSIDRVKFDTVDMLNEINELRKQKDHKGKVLIMDEAGVMLSARDWQSKNNKALMRILQIFRNMNFTVFFCVPSFSYIDKQLRTLFHGAITTSSPPIMKFKYYQVNPESTKIYRKKLRIFIDGRTIPLTNYKVPKPSQELIDVYEKKKWEFTNKTTEETLQQMREINKHKIGKVESKHYCCVKCGTEWDSRLGKTPTKCPHCSSRYWMGNPTLRDLKQPSNIIQEALKHGLTTPPVPFFRPTAEATS